MSLRVFHVIFITASALLALGCGIWGLRNYWLAGRGASDLVFGLVSLLVCVGLILYERYALKKLKKVETL
jgi:FtsH-binding integral membrane protein